MISSERFNGIRAFVQAEQSGSFAAASAVLGLSQSAVSKAVARLEERLGVQLFHRTTRSLTLTDEGRIYLASCRRALDEMVLAETALTARKQVASGCVRVNLPDLYGRKYIAPLLMQLAKTHAQLHFELSFEKRFVNLFEEGYDLAVRIGALPDSADIAARRIGYQDVIICGAPSYLACHAKPENLQDLAQHSCITQFRAGRHEPWLVLNKQGQELRWPVPSGHSFAAVDMIAEAAIAGLGLAQLPRWLVEEHLASGALLPLLPDVPMPALPVHMIWLGGRSPAYRVRLTLDAIAAACAGKTGG